MAEEHKELSIDIFRRYDDRAIKILFEQYYTPLVLFACGFVSETDTGKDIVQEVFLALIERREQLDSIGNLKAYLYQATRNRCLKYLHHEEVKRKYVEEVQYESDEYYFDRILEEEVYHHLMNAISDLPEQCRKIYLLVLENKSNQEIAEMLSIGVETVKSHKKAGKRILRERLNNVILAVTLGFMINF